MEAEMGITFDKIDDLRLRGLLKSGCKVLDIGSSNLYSADPDCLRAFLAHYGVDADEAFIDRIAMGSTYGPNGGTNESFIGELLEQAGMTYLAFDIANGYRTQIFDLNTEAMPRNLAGSFDVVLNFGTTEHVINQLNAFRVIHDAVKVGGYIVHELPTSGYGDHGYFCYTPRFFFDLAGHNEYEVIEFAYHGPSPGHDINDIIRDYQSYFPALSNGLKTTEIKPDNIASYLILRKMKDAPLRLPSETSTSVHVKQAEQPNWLHRTLRKIPAVYLIWAVLIFLTGAPILAVSLVILGAPMAAWGTPTVAWIAFVGSACLRSTDSQIQ